MSSLTTTETTAEATVSSPTKADSSNLADIDEIAKKLSIPSNKPVDVTNYMNERYPTQQTLTSALPSLDSQLSTVEKRLQSELTTLIRVHRNDTEKTAKSIEETKEVTRELNSTLENLTETSNTVHKNLTESLQSAIPVYTALKNVTETLEALDALIALDESVNKLEGCVHTSNLKELANDPSPFQHINESIAKLDSLPSSQNVKGYSHLNSRATIAKESIRAILLNSFKLNSDAISNMDSTDTETHEKAVNILSSACIIAGAMGSDVRAEAIGSFIKRRRNSFKVVFSSNDSNILNSLDKRFSWIRKELRSHWTHLGGERIDKGWGRVFPKQWNVDRKLTDGLMVECKDTVCFALDNGQADKDVDLMILALKKSKEFEFELNRRFNVKEERASFVGNISDCFGPWMDSFVTHEDQHLTSIISDLIHNESWSLESNEKKNSLSNPSTENVVILKSATELFLAIKKSMNTCASLDVRQPLFSLHRVFRKHLTTYASVLVRNLPGIQVMSQKQQPEQSQDFENRLRKACSIINTSFYCSSTTEQLEESVKKTIIEVFRDNIDMNNERERFNTVCVKGIQSIILLIEQDVEDDIKTISNNDWTKNINTVGDASKYIENLNIKLGKIVKLAHKNLSNQQHFRFLLEKLANSIISRIKHHLYRLEYISNTATQQLLLDITTLRGFVISLPSSVNSPTSTTFVKFVNREMSKIEAILKVILAPLSSSVDTYVTLVGDNGSVQDLQRILEIKGLIRAEAAPLVLDYSRRIEPSRRVKPLSSVRDEVMRGNGSTVGAAGSNDSRTLLGSQKEGLISSHSQTNKNAQQGANSIGADAAEAAGAAVDSVRNLFGRLGTSIVETGADRLGQVSSQLEVTTDRIKKEAASARWSFFGK